MFKILKTVTLAAGLVGAAILGGVGHGQASEPSWSQPGNLMIGMRGVYLATQESINSVKLNGVAIAGADADVSEATIPELDITYFLTNSLAVEVICCVSYHRVTGEGTLVGLGSLGDTWVIPLTITAQYHMDMGAIKPYVGAGVTAAIFFNEDEGVGIRSALGAQSMEIDPAIGFAANAGVDFSLGHGWYANVDVKKIWLNTDVTWTLAGGGKVVADVDLDPLVVGVGLRKRLNLSDLF